MTFTWQELIDRARFYVDDDHDGDDAGWVDPSAWLRLFGVEYSQQYRRWVRAGLVAPKPTDTEFDGPVTSTPITGVLAVIGVAELIGTNYRVLRPSQTQDGRHPFRNPRTGPATSWEAHGGGDTLTIELDPADTGSYVARYIARPARPTSVSASVEVPDGADERLVLGAARRAHVKESSRSAAIDALILEADAELNFMAHSRRHGESPLVRRLPPSSTRFVTDPALYRYV
jgi:hypothetical protein